MKIALFGNEFSPNYIKYIKHLIQKLENENIKILVQQQFYDFLQENISFTENIQTFDRISDQDRIDFLFSIGGDGTLLRAVTYVRESNIPILGINTGRLGFISSISTDQIDDAVDHVLNGDYKIRSRTLLELETENNLFGTTNFALNEVAIVKKDTSSMIRIDAFIDDEFLNSYWADGLLISTPTRPNYISGEKFYSI